MPVYSIKYFQSFESKFFFYSREKPLYARPQAGCGLIISANFRLWQAMPSHLVKPTVLPATRPKLEYEVLQQDASPLYQCGASHRCWRYVVCRIPWTQFGVFHA